MADSSAAPLIKLTTALGEHKLRFRSLSATEEMGRLFEFDVGALADDGSIALADLLGTHASVQLELPGGKHRHFDGIVASAGLDGAHGKRVQYRLVLRPWLWLLTRRADTRIFQNKTVIEILKAVFDPYTPDLAEEQSGSFPPIEYCVQYRETDFDFVSRLMEREGLYYFFRHQAGRHTLVLVNKMSAHAAFAGYAGIPFRDRADAATDLETISEWRTQLEVQPGKVTLNDYNFETPATSLQAEHSSPRKGARTQFEHYDPPGDYPTQADGDRYAALRMEEFDARYMRVIGAGNTRGLAVGHRFTLKEHPIAGQNADHVVLSTRIDASHGGEESGDEVSHFSCSFTAIAASEVFRLPRLTPKPTVPGPQTAVVVGKAGEEIHTDPYGRVKVQFHWDRHGEKDENSSCWVRVSHPLAGKGFGMAALPRIGQEVVVDFLEGDPDRPLVTGRVYNAVQVPPYPLPDNASVSTLKSRSTKNGGADDFNELRFEDKLGSEMVWLQAQKDFYHYVKNDAHALIKHDQTRIVENDLNDHVKHDLQWTVGNDVKHKIGNDSGTKIVGHSAIDIGKSLGTKAAQDIAFESGAKFSVKSGAGTDIKIGANLGVDAAANVHIKGGANIVIEAGATLTLKGAMINIEGSGPVSIVGAVVKINSGGGGGAGAGASPKSPDAPAEPEPPEPPEDPLTHR